MLTNKVALITGAASGTGLAMAKLFAEKGAKIVAADYHPDKLDAAVKEIAATGASIIAAVADVSRQDQCEAMIDKAVEAFGGLDILINNAGVMDLMEPIGIMDLDLYRRVMAINVDGPVYAMRKAVPIMVKAGGGVIVNTASVAGVGGAAAGAAYVASKHALVGLTKNTAWAYAGKGIRCNAMVLGGIETNIMESVDASRLSPEGLGEYGKYHAINPRSLKPIEVAELALFLSDDVSSGLNGAIIPVDSGWRAA